MAWVWWYLGQPRSTQRRRRIVSDDEEALTAAIIRLASQYGRYGYRRITAMLLVEGWVVNHKRVERIWRREGLKVPRKQPKRGRLWFNDGSCVCLRPSWQDHVWADDFVQALTHDGRAFRMIGNGGDESLSRNRRMPYNRPDHRNICYFRNKACRGVRLLVSSHRMEREAATSHLRSSE